MRFPLKVVWVAGRISASSAAERSANVEAGRRLGMDVWRAGAVALVPHLNSMNMVDEGAMSEAEVYLGDLEMLGRCDAMIRVPGWEGSRGVAYETAWAAHLGLPIFNSICDLEGWLGTGAPSKRAAIVAPGAVNRVFGRIPIPGSSHELSGK